MNEIPDLQSMMLPVLQILGDGKEHPRQQLIQEVCDLFQLTEEQKNQLLPSGTQTYVENRVTWAAIYMGRAELVQKPKRAVYAITDSGKKLLSSSPPEINIAILKKLSLDFKKWYMRDNKKTPMMSVDVDESMPPTIQTPEEILGNTCTKLHLNLIDELLTKVKSGTPREFEQLVVDLLLKMGYGGSHRDAGRVIGKSGDGGIDGLINEDKLGLDTIYIQAKRYENAVPISHIRDFAGALLGKKTKKGIFITTSSFPESARDFVKSINECRIILVDGEQLANLMIEHNVGVTVKDTYEIKRLDSDYFDEL